LEKRKTSSGKTFQNLVHKVSIFYIPIPGGPFKLYKEGPEEAKEKRQEEDNCGE